MKVLMLFLVSALILFTSDAFADTYVHGYYKSNGTYVAPYYRSSPDSSYNNNYSVKGNVNPYTGSYGTQSPTTNDHTPDYNKKNYGNPLYDSSGSY